MKTTKRKSKTATKQYRTAPAKRNRTAPAERKSTVTAQHDTKADILGGEHWTITIEPEETIFIAENMAMCQMVIKNHGPEIVRLCAVYGDQLDLWPGKLRVTDAWGKISVENTGNKSVLIEVDFMPRTR